MSERENITQKMIAYKGSMSERYGESISFRERMFSGKAFRAGAEATLTLNDEDWECCSHIILHHSDASEALTALGFRRAGA